MGKFKLNMRQYHLVFHTWDYSMQENKQTLEEFEHAALKHREALKKKHCRHHVGAKDRLQKRQIKGSFYASNITFIAEAYAEEDKALSLESYTQ